MTEIEPLTSRINLFMGMVTALLSYVFGDHWVLFVFFLLLNCGDYLTRWMAARITGTENSRAGWLGILKKLGYWVMIALGFGMSIIFIEIGMTIGINLEITEFIGWFVLATLIVNEIRSILENLVEAGYKVPIILTKGLEVANKAIDGKLTLSDAGAQTTIYKTDAEMNGKTKVTLEVDDTRARSGGGTPCSRG